MSESRAELRKNIEEYLKVRKYLNIAAARVVNEKKYHIIDDIAKNYEVTCALLKIKVNILNQMHDYDEERNAYETAVGSILNNMKTVEIAAARYKLNPETVRSELHRYVWTKINVPVGPYIYDKCLDEGRIFLFREELSLMNELRQWKYKSPSPCSCFICAIELLSSLAYNFAKTNNKLYPPSWNDNMRADADWLIKFVMAHDCRLSKLYPNYDNNVQELLETCKNKI